jgi:hypothetical protein
MLYLLDSSVKYIYMPFYPCALVYQDNVGVLTWIGYEYYVDSIFPVLVFFSDPLETSKKPCTL